LLLSQNKEAVVAEAITVHPMPMDQWALNEFPIFENRDGEHELHHQQLGRHTGNHFLSQEAFSHMGYGYGIVP
jgi:hypothetical protein